MGTGTPIYYPPPYYPVYVAPPPPVVVQPACRADLFGRAARLCDVSARGNQGIISRTRKMGKLSEISRRWQIPTSKCGLKAFCSLADYLHTKRSIRSLLRSREIEVLQFERRLPARSG